jgi:hypothetical protein
MPGLLTLHKLGTRIDWNPAGKPGPVDVERVGLFRVRVRNQRAGRERDEGTMSETTGTVCRDMQDIAQNCDPSRSERESYQDTAVAHKYSELDMLAPRLRTEREGGGAGGGREGDGREYSKCVISPRRKGGPEKEIGGGREGGRDRYIVIA